MPDRIADRDQAIEWARGLLRRDNVVILDTETTGMGPDDEIIQIAAIDGAGKIVASHALNPDKEISAEATAIHGITQKDLVMCPSIEDVWPVLSRLLQGRTLVAYNAEFDSRMLRQTLDRYQLPGTTLSWDCAMVAYAAFCGNWDSRKGDYKWPKLPGAQHGALADCRATLELIQHMAAAETSAEAEYGNEGPKTIAREEWLRQQGPLLGVRGDARESAFETTVTEEGVTPLSFPLTFVVADPGGREIIRIPAGVDPVPLLCNALMVEREDFNQILEDSVRFRDSMVAAHKEKAELKAQLRLEQDKAATYQRSLQATWAELDASRAETAALRKRIENLYSAVMKESVL